ncbi:MAG: type II toxin-antitoxin system RelE/ParE family toxin [Betaproteobacteria bacterium]|nr:type II toxin-antitoxin system RelE/ParE family toxin [Betaproteobacteria bacterium]
MFAYIAEVDSVRAGRTIQRIRDAVLILEDHPFIGRPAEEGRRELVMGRRSEAYVALYRWLLTDDTVLILAIWNSKEAGYFDV